MKDSGDETIHKIACNLKAILWIVRSGIFIFTLTCWQHNKHGLKVMCPAIANNSAVGNKKHVIFHVITFNVEMRQPLLLSASACALLCEASISCDQFCITMELTNHNPIF